MYHKEGYQTTLRPNKPLYLDKTELLNLKPKPFIKQRVVDF